MIKFSKEDIPLTLGISIEIEPSLYEWSENRMIFFKGVVLFFGTYTIRFGKFIIEDNNE